MLVALGLLTQAVPTVASDPSIRVISPRPDEVVLTREVNVTGTALGSYYWLNHTGPEDFNGTHNGTDIIPDPSGGIGLWRHPYDDFQDGTLDSSLWSVQGSDRISVDETGGELGLAGTGNSDYFTGTCEILTNATGFSDFSADVRLESFNGDFKAGISFFKDNGEYYHFGIYYIFKRDVFYVECRSSTEGGQYNNLDTPPHSLRITYDPAGNGFHGYADGKHIVGLPMQWTDFHCGIFLSILNDTVTVDARFSNVSAGHSTGSYFSPPIDTNMVSPGLWDVNWTASAPDYSKVEVAFRSSAFPDMVDPSNWTKVNNGTNCSFIGMDRYIQYNVSISMVIATEEPGLRSIHIQVHKPVVQVEVSPDRRTWFPTCGTLEWWAIVPVPDGSQTLFCRATDALGDIAETKVPITVDATPPEGRLSINGGLPFTAGREVGLSLCWSGRIEVTEMQLSNNPDFSLVQWEPVRDNVSWIVSDGDGQKWVYARLRDRYRLVSGMFNASVTLDTRPPTGNVTINDGYAFTDSPQARVRLDAEDENGIAFMQLTEGDVETAPWIPFQHTVGWTLTTGHGQKTVRARFKDGAGLVSDVASATILFMAEEDGSMLPQVKMVVNNGSGFTRSPEVTVYFHISGGSASRMRLDDGNPNSSRAWRKYENPITWGLSGSDSPKTLRAWFATPDGLIFKSEANVTLDTLPPTGNLTINDGEGFTYCQTVRLSIAGDDVNVIESMMVSSDAGFAGVEWERYETERIWTLPPGNGTMRVHILLRDRAGWVSAPACASIELDMRRPIPTGTVLIDGGARYTRSALVVLSLDADAVFLSGASQMMISNLENFSEAAWEPFNYTKDWDLPAGDGKKTVHVMYRVGHRKSPSVNASIILDTVTPASPVLDRYPRTTRKANLILSGWAEPGCLFNVSDRTAPVDADGRFIITVPLRPGNNDIVLSLTDPAGNTNATHLVVTRENAPDRPDGLLPLAAVATVLVAVAVLLLFAWLWRRR